MSDVLRDVSTWCVNCLFAQYDGDTQVGCKKGRLEKFSERGASVALITIPPNLDEDGNEIPNQDTRKFYQIGGRFCNLCRDSESMAEIPRDEWETRAVAFAETRIDAIVYHDQTSTVDGLRLTLESINRQTLKPLTVTIVVHDATLNNVDYYSAVPKGMNSTIVRIIADLTHAGALREAMKKATGNYIALADAGHRFGAGDFRRLDRRINEELEIVPMAFEHGALFISRSLLAHPMVGYDLDFLLRIANGETPQ